MVVMAPPVADDGSSPPNASEPVLASGAHLRNLPFRLSAKALKGRFAGLNKVQLDGPPFAPKEHRLAGELRAVVADDGVGQAASPIDPIEETRHLGAGDGQ